METAHPAGLVTRLRSAGCVFAEDEADLLVSAARSADELEAMVERRVCGLPLEHVIGWTEFCGLRIAVDPGVFVPRRRTEFLVAEAVALLNRAGDQPVVVIDLCCGSGAVGAALADRLDGVELHAADLDPAGVRCARRNLSVGEGRVYEGDLFEALPASLRGRAGLVVANVPYVPSRELGLLPAEAREHEPMLALDGGADGLDVLRRVAAAAPRWLAPGGHLLSETGRHQASRAIEALRSHGLAARARSSEELDATVVIGSLPARGDRPSAPECDPPGHDSTIPGRIGDGDPDGQRDTAGARQPRAR